MPIKDKTGERFGRLIVLRLSHRDSAKRETWWTCRCDCGTESAITNNSLLGGHTRSCGCLHREGLIERSTKHGGAARGRKGKLYVAWTNMKARCYRPTAHRYPSYGARGIKVCGRWRDDFAAFATDVGEGPPGKSLDRIDVNGHYSCGQCPECQVSGWPKNVRWATANEQAHNKVDSVKLTYQGVTRSLPDWSRETGVSARTLWQRYKVLGWAPEKVISEPPHKKRVVPERLRVLSVRRTMIQRCYDTKCHSYPGYGGRGITVCDRWRSSGEAFIADLGPRPSTCHTLDRIDNNKGYWCGRPECLECGPLGRTLNCRWATRRQQTGNRRPRRNQGPRRPPFQSICRT